MPKHRFVIEREVPGAGAKSSEDWSGLARASCEALDALGPSIQWVESFVTPDKVYCIYLASDEPTIREHARRVGIPANRISRVDRIIDPTAAA